MILIAGATGNLGQSVVNQLISRIGVKGFAILARNAEKASDYKSKGIEVRIADYDQPEGLVAAFSGVTRLLLISTMAMNRKEQHRAVVDAAVRAGVWHIVYTGLAIRDIETSAVRDLMVSHFETENHIKASGLTYTFLRNTMYAEAIPQITGPRTQEHGIVLAGGAGRVPYALRSEMGEAAANLMLQEGHGGRTYQITGPAAWSYEDVAAGLSEQFGYAIPYLDIEPDTYRADLIAAGLPEFMVYLTAGTVADIRNGQYDIVSSDLERLLGRAPKTLAGMLSEVFP